jgi:hypothetical protein
MDEVFCYITFLFVVIIYTFCALAVYVLINCLPTGKIISDDYYILHDALVCAPVSLSGMSAFIK